MEIYDLFQIIQDKFESDELNGEFLLHGNVIIWSFELSEMNNELDNSFNDQYDDEPFCFGITSTEELLQESYNTDKEKLLTVLDDIDETSNWIISDSEIINNRIIFKIF